MKLNTCKFWTVLVFIFTCLSLQAQNPTEKSVEGNANNLPVREYTLTIDEEMVNKAGKEVTGMTVNGRIPGHTLSFTEGEFAVIYVKNNLNEETSVHWHGLMTGAGIFSLLGHVAEVI